MTAPATAADEASLYGQANPDGPTQASVYNGASAIPDVSLRTLATLAAGETPVIGARRIDHANATDYGFGADGIEYVLTTAGGVLITDVAGLIPVAVLNNDEPGGADADDRVDTNSLTISTPPVHGAAVAYHGFIYYAPVAGYDGDDSLQYTVDNDAAETSAATDVTLTVAAPTSRDPIPILISVPRGGSIFANPVGAVLSGDDELRIVVQAVEVTTAAARGTATVVGRTVQYQAPADLNGQDQFSWRVLLNGIWSQPGIVNVRVGRPVVRPGLRRTRRVFPIGDTAGAVPEIRAVADFAITAYATAVTISPLLNDVGADLEIQGFTDPAGGGVVDNEDGTLTYTPGVGFSGVDRFTCTITDGVSDSTAPITVFVGPPALTATDDAAATSPATPVVISVLDNDAGAGLFVAAVSDPPRGSAAITDVDQTVTYTPDAGWVGLDTFSYTIEDSSGHQRTATVRVTTISAIAAVDDVAGTPQGHAVTISPLGNDTGVGLAIVAHGNPSNGSASITGGGTTVLYTPNSAFVGEDQFTYRIEDDFGQQATAMIRVGVTAGPVSAVPDVATTEGVTPVEIPVLGNDVGSGLTVTAVTQPPAGQGSVVRSSGNTKVTYIAPAGFSGSTSFQYTCGNSLGSSSASVSVTVTKPPLNPQPDAAVTDSDTPVAIDPLANDVGTSLEIVDLGAIAPAGAGTAAITGGGLTITFTPAAGYTGPAGFAYTVEDSSGFRASSTVAVTVNAPPTETFANGYEAMGETYVGPDSESMTGFELLLDYTDDRLKLRSAGGVVYSSSGHDVRLEDGAGNAVPYARLLYDGAAGRLVAIVKRDRGTGSTWNKVEIYAGKFGAADQANPASALSGLLACIRTDTGADLTGNGRNLTVTGATATTLFGAPSAQFDRIDDKLELADPSAWLNGLAALTISGDYLLDQIAVDGGVVRVGGSVTGADNTGRLSFRPDATSFYANPAITNFWFVLLKINISGTPTDCRVEGADGAVPVGRPHTMAVAWASGEAITIVADDAVQTPAYISPATPAGTLSVTGGPLAVGYGPRGPFGGRVGLLRIAGARRSNAWLRAEQRNRLYPRKMVAAGGMRTPTDSASCVAYPDTATATGPDLAISPLSNDTGSGLSIVSATAENGTVSIASSTTLLYRQPAAFAGTDHATYTIQDSAGRRSTSIVTITVSGAPLVLTDDSTSTVGTAPVEIDVLANDSGVDMTVTAVGDPAHGGAAITSGGTKVTYTADLPFYGAEAPFSYTVTDGAGQTRSANINVVVSRPPIAAINDAATVVAGTTSGVVISPLANDTGVGLFISALGAVSLGSATRISSNTQVRYTPPASVASSTNVTFTYTIQDAYGQTTTGSITVTVTPGAASVVAVDDNTTATSGETQTISPLANDTGTGLTISALGTPSQGGAATRITGNTQVQYTPLSTFVGTETISYTASDGTNTDTAIITAIVSPPATGRPKHPPAPASSAKIITVGYNGPSGSTRKETLAEAYALATGGTHIFLNDGTYATDFNFNRAFPASNPVIIRSRNVSNGRSPMANFTGLYTVSGAGHWFYEVRWTRTTPSGDGVPSTYTLGISASNITITRNWFNTPNGINVSDGVDRANINIGWNRFVTSADRIGAFIFIQVLNDLALPTSKFRSSSVYNNYFNKTVPSLNGNDAYNLYIGNEHAKRNTSAVLSEVYIEYNYLAGGNQMKMYLKRGITSLSYNHVVGGGQFGFRHGTVRYASPASLNTKDYPTGRAYGNRVIGANFTVAGAGCDIRGNYLDNSQGFIIFPGSENDPSRTTRGETQAASDALFVGNYVDRSNSEFAPYNFGYIDQTDDVLFEGGGGRIRNCNIWGHTGDTIQKTGPKSSGNIIYNAGFVDASTININAGMGGYTVPATITLNPDTDVGFQVANQNLTT